MKALVAGKAWRLVLVLTVATLLVAMPAYAGMEACINGAVKNTVKVGLGAAIAVGLDVLLTGGVLTAAAVASGAPILGAFGSLGYGCVDGVFEENKSASTSRSSPSAAQRTR